MTTGGSAVPGGRVAAWVDDIPISVREFEERYYQQAESMRQRFGNAFTPELEKQLGLRRVTLSQIVSEKIQVREAERLGIQVSDEEVALRIQEAPTFQRNGQFDPDLYQSILRANRLNPRQFENQQRLALAVENLRRYIGLGAAVSESEIRATYQWLNESIRVEFIRVKPNLFSKDVVVGDADLQSHYEKNKNSFRVGARRKAAWWYLPFKGVSDDLTLKEDEIKAHFTATQSRYRLKEEVTVKQILLKVPPDSDKGKIEEARKKLTEILGEILKGKTFEEMAKAHSEGPEAAQGGALGTFGRKQMIPELESTAFSLKEGEVSEPIQSQFGIHLLKVTKHQKAGVLPFEKAKSQVEKSLREAKARDEAKRLLRLVRYNVEDKKAEPELKGLQKGETEFFEKDLPPLSTPENKVLASLVFDLKDKGQISKEKFGEEGILFVRLLEIKEPTIPELKDIRDQVRASYVSMKAGEVAAGKTEEWFKEIQEGKKTFQGLVTELKVDIEKPEPFARESIPEEFGRGNDLMPKIFGLKKGEVTKVVSGGDVLFIHLVERPKLDMSNFKNEEKDLRKNILNQKRNMIFGRRIEQLRKASKIRLESGFSI
jgi:peptidyl-prolyl cis-trans isomerase D